MDFAYKLNKDLEQILIPKKPINYMPDHSEEEEEVDTKKEMFFSEGEVKEKIEKYITGIAMKEDKKDEIKKEETKEGKAKGGKERKVERMVTLSYKENALIHRLCKCQLIQ